MQIYNFEYPVTLTPEDGGYVVTFDDPEGRFQGADFASSEAEALKAAQALLDAMIDAAISRDEAIPAPSRLQGGSHRVSPSPQALAKLALFHALQEEGLTKADLARRLGWKYPQVQRLFDVSHASKLEQLTAAAQAMNRRFVIGMDAQA